VTAAAHTTPRVSRFLVERLVAGLDQLGVDTPAVLRRCRLDGDALARLPERVPYAIFHDLFVALGEVTGERSFGVRLAELGRPEIYDVFGYVLRSSATLGDALLRTGRYLRLVTDAVDFTLHVDGDRALLLHRDSSTAVSHPEAIEFAVAAVAVIARRMTGKALVPIEARFIHDAPADVAHHVRVFGAPVRFRQLQNGLVFPAELLHLEIASRDARLCALLERQAEQLLAALPEAGHYTRRVQELLAEELRGGSPTAARIAKRLAMHPKTLGRRLRLEGTSLQQLLDSVRRGLAERYLIASDTSVSEVAFLLGFADPTAFHKAFKRWTGITPHAFRRRTRFSGHGDGSGSQSSVG